MDDHSRIYLKTTLKMSDSSILEGEVILALGGELERTLNNVDATVILFRDNNGERFITKSYIVEAKEHKKERG